MPQLSRSALYRCLKRHGLSKIGSIAKCPPLTSAALKGPYCFEITAIKIGGPDDVFAEVSSVFLAVEEVTREVYAQVAKATPKTAGAFLDRLVAEFPQKINKVTTDIQRTLFTYSEPTSGGNLAAVGQHPFCGRLPRQRDRPHSNDSAVPRTLRAEEALPRRRNPIGWSGPFDHIPVVDGLSRRGQNFDDFVPVCP